MIVWRAAAVTAQVWAGFVNSATNFWTTYLQKPEESIRPKDHRVPVNSDPQERARVRSRIGSLILEFWAIQLKYGGTFLMEELRNYVELGMYGKGKIAPDSPGRILRQLRQKRRLNYKVVSRSQSMYRMKLVADMPAEPACGTGRQAELFARAS